MTPPSVFEADGHSRELYPQEARLRSLTYASPVFIGACAVIVAVVVVMIVMVVVRGWW